MLIWVQIIGILRCPGDFSHEGHEYGVKIDVTMGNALLTLNGFYGRSLDPVYQQVGPPGIGFASDGRLLFNMPYKGYYPRFKFLGATYTRDVPFLAIPIGGSPEPVLHVEALYAFDSEFNTGINTIEKYDEIRAAIGFDWKAKIDFLNPTVGISISPQLYLRRISDYPTDYKLGGSVDRNNWMTTLMVSTAYVRNTINPSVFWMRDVNSKGNFYKINLGYDPSNNWHYNIGVLLLNGRTENDVFKIFTNKNQIYFKAEYRWG